MQFPDISRYAETEADVNYANAVSGISVNGTDYSNYYDVYEDDSQIPYSWEISVLWPAEFMTGSAGRGEYSCSAGRRI